MGKHSIIAILGSTERKTMWTALRSEKTYILCLFLFYLVSQGLILIVSGFWFDDWCIINISKEGLKLWALEAGKPEIYPIIFVVNLLPDITYKLLIFISHFIISICFFMVSKKCFRINSSEAFFLTLVYLCIPMNDVRIERLNLMYTLGLTFFSLAFCLFIYKYEELSVSYRLLSLVLFWLSYLLLNSLMCFMGIVWLIIFLKEKGIKGLLKKIDYFILPFAYFAVDNVFFSAHGVYAGYNSVSIGKMLGALKDTFIVGFSLVRQVFSLLLLKPIVLYPVILLVLLLLAAVFYRVYSTKQFDEEQKGNVNGTLKAIMTTMLWGVAALYAGIYPYVVVGNRIDITSFGGRNGILVPFGLTLIIYVLLKNGLKKEYRCIAMLFLMVASVAHFTNTYIGYQRVYYSQRGLQVHLAKNLEVGNLKTVIVVEKEYSGWYIYNGIFEEVYGNENRLVDGIKSYQKVLNGDYQNFVNREWYNMTGFDINYRKIDGVILYSNNLSAKEAFLARIHEIMGEDISNRLICNSSFKILYPADEEFSNYIVQ